MSRNSIIKIFVFLITLIVLDQIAGRILRQLYFSQKSGPEYNLRYSIKDCSSRLLIFGNSRAQHHYDTRIFKDSLGISCFNAGQDGGHSIFLPYCQIRLILKRYNPEIIILEFDPNSVDYNPTDYEKLSVLLPYYRDYPEIQPLLLMRGKYEKIKHLSQIYPFNSDLVNILRYNSKAASGAKKDFYGYVPMNNRVIDTINMVPAAGQEGILTDTVKLHSLRSIIRECRSHNTMLLIVTSPKFHTSEMRKMATQTTQEKMALNIIKAEKAQYLDFSKDPLFIGRADLFADFNHLNLKGATIFSGILAGWIKNNTSLPAQTEDYR